MYRHPDEPSGSFLSPWEVPPDRHNPSAQPHFALMGNWSPAQRQQVAHMLRRIDPEAIRHQGQALNSRPALPQGSNFA
ncbi:TPA: hypothetical protein ACH3X1_008130 [Trebouxia sp. C0004]